MSDVQWKLLCRALIWIIRLQLANLALTKWQDGRYYEQVFKGLLDALQKEVLT